MNIAASPGQAGAAAETGGGRPRGDRPLPESSITICIARAAEILGQPIPPAIFEDAMPPDEDDDGLRAALRAARMSGLEVGYGELDLGDLDASTMPAVMTTAFGAVVIEGRAGKTWRVFDARLGTEPTWVAEADLRASLSGEGVLLRRRAEGDNGHGSDAHWFRGAIAQNKWAYVQVVIAAAVANVLALTTSIFIMVVYDRVLPNEAIESLVALTIGVGIALGFDFLIRTLRAGFIDKAGQRADMAMGRAIFERLMSIRLASRTGSTGAIASSLREFDSLRDFFASASLAAIVDLPFIFLFIFVISLIGGPLATVPLIAVPVVLVVALATQPMLARLSERSFRDSQSKQSVLFEALSGLETIKASRAEARMTARWERALSAQALHGVRARAISQFALNSTALVQQTAQIMIVFYGVLLITDGQLSMGALIASVILTGRALTPLAQVAQTLMRTAQARTAYKAIDRLMTADSERPAGRRYLSRDRLEGRLDFAGVSFTYPGARQPSLRDVSLSIAPGEKVAIIGPVGSGKSTLARLAIGVFEPQTGAVRVDGTDIRQIDPGDLRRNIGVCLQDNWLFSGSLRENIAIGVPRATDADILEASKIAGVDAFVARMPEGYDLAISERGEGLSGGQRQAIALARTLLARAPVLILDEPTSAMDAMTEKSVVNRLKPHVADRTVILVTHRPALFELVDRVIVLQDGKVVADGPRDAILGKGGQGAGESRDA